MECTNWTNLLDLVMPWLTNGYALATYLLVGSAALELLQPKLDLQSVTSSDTVAP